VFLVKVNQDPALPNAAFRALIPTLGNVQRILVSITDVKTTINLNVRTEPDANFRIVT